MSDVAIIGYGEVGGVLARDLAEQGAAIAAFDIAEAAQARAASAGFARGNARGRGAGGAGGVRLRDRGLGARCNAARSAAGSAMRPWSWT